MANPNPENPIVNPLDPVEQQVAIPQPQVPNLQPQVENPLVPDYVPAGPNLFQVIQPQNQTISVRLTDTNYLIWRLQVLAAVCGYGLEGFLFGTYPAPPEFLDGPNGVPVQNPAFVQWQRQDQLLASWLLSSITEGIMVKMVGNDSASELWNSLTLTFATQSKAKIMQYKLQIQTLKKGTMSMHEYLTKMKAYCDVLASIGHKIYDEDHILHIISGLGTEYDPVMVTITSRTESWTVKDVGALLLSFETRLE